MKKIFLLTVLMIFTLNAQLVPTGNTQDGPFRDTQIITYIDKKNKAICYLYIPNSVQTTLSYSGGSSMTFLNGFAGNISCLKKESVKLYNKDIKQTEVTTTNIDISSILKNTWTNGDLLTKLILFLLFLFFLSPVFVIIYTLSSVLKRKK